MESLSIPKSNLNDPYDERIKYMNLLFSQNSKLTNELDNSLLNPFLKFRKHHVDYHFKGWKWKSTLQEFWI